MMKGTKSSHAPNASVWPRCMLALLACVFLLGVVTMNQSRYSSLDKLFHKTLQLWTTHYSLTSPHRLAAGMSKVITVNHGGKTREVVTVHSPLLAEQSRAAEFLRRKLEQSGLQESADSVAKLAATVNALPLANSDDFVVQSDVFPNEHYRPEVGSGEVATVVNTDTVYHAGLFNGAVGDSHRARIPAFISFLLTVEGEGDIETDNDQSRSNVYQLNMAEGYFVRLLQLQSGSDSFTVAQRTYAHRVLSSVLVVEVELSRNAYAGSESLRLSLLSQSGNETSEDVQLDELQSPFKNTRMLFGQTRVPEVDGASVQNVSVLFDTLPQSIELPSSSSHAKWTFLMSVAEDPLECTSAYQQAAKLALTDTLFTAHSAAWVALWNSGSMKLAMKSSFDGAAEQAEEQAEADEETHPVVTRAMRVQERMAVSVLAGQYFLLSSLKTSPDGAAYALSPGSLAHGALNIHDYLGHAFWDQETWMYPPVLLLHADWAKRLLEYRVARLEAALHNAMRWGNSGAQYPWESAHTGLEVCPGDRWARYQIHISGDISLAIQQYVYLANDADWFYTPVPAARDSAAQSQGQSVDGHSPYETVLSIARFWSKRVQLNERTALYEVHGVMPPDEWHWNVSNSVYTNVVAGLALRTPYDLWTFTKPSEPVPDELLAFKQMGERMFVLFDANANYHPEFDGYEKGEVVLQADIPMLTYPLQYNGSDMTLESMRNDLLLYEPAVSFRGPAMTWPMFSIGWLALRRLAGADQQEILLNANRLLLKSFLYIQPPFNIWTEGYFGLGCVNFITGYGGYLQNYLNGFLGIRIRRDRLEFDPLLPDAVDQISLTFNYRKCRLDFKVDAVNWTVTLRDCVGDKSFTLLIYSTAERVQLIADEPVQRPRGQFAVLEN